MGINFVPDVATLTHIFSNAVAPAFFLGAVAAFVSLMMSRLAAVNERIRATRALPDQDSAAAASSMALGPLTRRARLLNDEPLTAAEKELSISRGMDSWGVVSGDLLEEGAEISNQLRELKS